MADEKLSTRQRQLREQEEQAQAQFGAGKAGDPEFVVPGPGGQFVGEDEDEGKSPADLVVRETPGVKARKEAEKSSKKGAVKDDSAQRDSAVKRGDNEK